MAISELRFTTKTQVFRDLKISYLGGVALSAKLVHSLSVNVATYGIYLAPADISGYNVCPNNKHCRAHCLFTSGHNMLAILGGKNNVNESRVKKTRLFFENNELFMQLLINEIAFNKLKYEDLGYYFAVRLNCTSDINISDFNLNGKNITEIFPDVTFYEYTKVFSYLNNVNKYPNLDYTYSYNGYNWNLCQSALKKNVRVAVVFEKIPKYFNGIPVINGDNSDFRPADDKNVIVGLKFKKTSNSIKNNKFVLPETPFVVKENDDRCEY